MTKPLIVHGLDLSYFTGKLEAYLRAKGLAYRLREMDTRDFAACAEATGVRQMPQVECPDGSWLTDTTLIIRHLEQHHPEPALTPADPVTRFIALLIEDMGDETLWRPALFYRWAFADDARLMSGRLAAGMLRDLPLPFAVRRQMILRRQQWTFLRQDGVTARTRAAVIALYHDALAAMEMALEQTPFVLGMRPTAADFGLFGSMFRHFFSDPTPARIMREQAPRTLAWVTRLWALTPAALAGQPVPGEVPRSALGLLRLASETHLPYLAANAQAVAENQRQVRFADRGAEFRTPASPYRAWCLDQLRVAAVGAAAADRPRLEGLLGPQALAILMAPRQRLGSFAAPVLPIRPAKPRQPVDRAWRR